MVLFFFKQKTAIEIPLSPLGSEMVIRDRSADAGYQGAPQREELAEVDVDWLIAERPGKVKTLKQHPRKNKTAINIEYMKASIRAKVEHPFRIIKRQFGFVKARYKGLLKNDNQLAMLFTLANLFRVDQMIRQWERSQ